MEELSPPVVFVKKPTFEVMLSLLEQYGHAYGVEPKEITELLQANAEIQEDLLLFVMNDAITIIMNFIAYTKRIKSIFDKQVLEDLKDYARQVEELLQVDVGTIEDDDDEWEENDMT